MGIRDVLGKVGRVFARGLTAVPKFIRGVAEKVRSVPVLGTIAKTAYESLVPEAVRTGIDVGLTGAEELGKAIGRKVSPEEYLEKPSGPPPKPPGPGIKKPRGPPPEPPVELPSIPSRKIPGAIAPTRGDIMEQLQGLKKPGLRKPTGPLPLPPTAREQTMEAIRRRAY